MFLACSFGTISNKVDGKIICIPCIKCNAGFGMNHNCHNVVVGPIKVECVECGNGSYSVGGTFDTCIPCGVPCDSNEIVTKKCEVWQNRVCDCNHGFYRHGTSDKCTQKCCYCFGSESMREIKCENMLHGKVCMYTF